MASKYQLIGEYDCIVVELFIQGVRQGTEKAEPHDDLLNEFPILTLFITRDNRIQQFSNNISLTVTCI